MLRRLPDSGQVWHLGPFEAEYRCKLMKDWQKWLQECRAASAMRVNVISLDEAAHYGDKPEQRWSVQQEDGVDSHIGRSDKRFFSGIFVLITLAAREVIQWVQMMLLEVTKPGDEGVVVLIRDGEGRFLVQAKAEPGNDREGCVLLAPTLQASKSNLDQAHGGKRPPYAELLDELELGWTKLPADGARFFHKTNSYAVATLDASVIEAKAGWRWFTSEELREALHVNDPEEPSDVNEHLAHAWFVALQQ